MPELARPMALAFALLVLPATGCAGPSPAPGNETDATGPAEPAGVASCEEVLEGTEIHEHARVEIYLASERPYDFSPERYQLAHRTVHFEAEKRDAGGAIIHLHESRPTMGCLLETLGWTVEPGRIVTDQGEVYEASWNQSFEVFVDGQLSEAGFNTPLEGGHTFVLRFDSSASPSPCPNLTGHSVHEHAQLEVLLNSSEPWDFSPSRYQHQAPHVAFEDGRQDRETARIHVHQARPTLSCLFSSIGWEVSEHRIETDTGPIYEATPDEPIEVLVNGEPADQGFETPIQRAHSYEVRYNATAEG